MELSVHPQKIENAYSGMVTSTGRQARFSNLHRNDAASGRSDMPAPRRLAKPPEPTPPTLPVADNNPRSSSCSIPRLLSETLSSKGGEETKRSLSLCRTFATSLLFCGRSSSSSSSSPLITGGSELLRLVNRRRSVRERNILRVLRRRR